MQDIRSTTKSARGNTPRIADVKDVSVLSVVQYITIEQYIAVEEANRSILRPTSQRGSVVLCLSQGHFTVCGHGWFIFGLRFMFRWQSHVVVVNTQNTRNQMSNRSPGSCKEMKSWLWCLRSLVRQLRFYFYLLLFLKYFTSVFEFLRYVRVKKF